MKSYEPNRDLLTRVKNTSGTNVISQFDYQNDVLGRRTLRLDTGAGLTSGRTNTFGYNSKSELTAAAMGTNAFGYNYDPIGNRTSATNNGATTTYQANLLNQYTNIVGAGAAVPKFDADGNLTNSGSLTFNWDAENRLTSVISNGTTIATFQYDYMSRRFSKSVMGVTNKFIYDGWNLITEIVAAPATVTNLVSGGSFETPNVGSGTYYAFQYSPTNGIWSFGSGSGVSGNGSGFTVSNPNAPLGTQVCFLQSTGRISQAIGGFVPGCRYKLVFNAAQRANHQITYQVVQVDVNGVSLGSYQPSGTSYQTITTPSFVAGSNQNVIVFKGLNPNGGDNTAFIDNVRVVTEAITFTNNYVWGLDLSGSLQGAGGIGGLLASYSTSTSRPAYFAVADGNGNITDLVSTNGTSLAHYEFDPYGNTIVKSGSMADANPFRFSSKYYDSETGLYYYGYRYYDPVSGRWLGRDPIEEEGGAIYSFVDNNSIDVFDYLGLTGVTMDEVKQVAALGEDAMKQWIKSNPEKAREMYHRLRKFSSQSAQTFKRAHKFAKLRPSRITRGAPKSGSASVRVLSLFAVAQIGVMVGQAGIAVADNYDLWSDPIPQLSVKRQGPRTCQNGEKLYRVKYESVQMMAESVNVLLLLGHSNPTYWYENSLTITCECRTCPPDEDNPKITIDDSSVGFYFDVWFGLGFAQGTVFRYHEAVEFD